MSQQIQPPPQTDLEKWEDFQVDFVSCSCIQPDIKPVAHRASVKKKSCNERVTVQSSLLPGLPDDLAVACLIRVPRIQHRKLRLVCKRWNQLLSENLFYSLRKTHGLAEEWLYVIKRNNGRISVHAFDPIYQLWQPLPPVPGEYSKAYGFGCAVLSGCHLYLFGGKHPKKGTMRSVIFYCARTNQWCRARDMHKNRHWLRYGSCVINNCLYVSGGECEKINGAVRFAEVYDPNQNRWNLISETSIIIGPFFGFVHDGTWFLKGHGSNNKIMCEAYSPETDTWSPFCNEMVNGLSYNELCISLNGQLYALDCWNGLQLTVYDKATDSWKKLMDSKLLHLRTSRGFNVSAVVPLKGKLCIIRENLSIILVDVSSPNKQVVVESNKYIRENIARDGLKGVRVDRCQVLEA